MIRIYDEIRWKVERIEGEYFRFTPLGRYKDMGESIVRIRFAKEPEAICDEEIDKNKSHWVTINGEHVLIGPYDTEEEIASLIDKIKLDYQFTVAQSQIRAQPLDLVINGKEFGLTKPLNKITKEEYKILKKESKTCLDRIFSNPLHDEILGNIKCNSVVKEKLIGKRFYDIEVLLSLSIIDKIILTGTKGIWENLKHNRDGKKGASIVAFMPIFRKVKFEYEEEIDGEIKKVNKTKIAMCYIGKDINGMLCYSLEMREDDVIGLLKENIDRRLSPKEEKKAVGRLSITNPQLTAEKPTTFDGNVADEEYIVNLFLLDINEAA